MGMGADDDTIPKIVNRPPSHQTKWNKNVRKQRISYFGLQIQNSQNNPNMRNIRGCVIAPSWEKHLYGYRLKIQNCSMIRLSHPNDYTRLST